MPLKEQEKDLEKAFKEKLTKKLKKQLKILEKLGACRTSKDPCFYSEDLVEQERVIERFCKNCVVQQSCLDFALTNKEQGIWGGTTEETRVTILDAARFAYGANAEKPFYFPSSKTLPVVLRIAKEYSTATSIPVRAVGRPGKEKKTRPNPLV